jgi:hypothetical protein
MFRKIVTEEIMIWLRLPILIYRLYKLLKMDEILEYKLQSYMKACYELKFNSGALYELALEHDLEIEVLIGMLYHIYLYYDADANEVYTINSDGHLRCVGGDNCGNVDHSWQTQVRKKYHTQLKPFPIHNPESGTYTIQENGVEVRVDSDYTISLNEWKSCDPSINLNRGL